MSEEIRTKRGNIGESVLYQSKVVLCRKDKLRYSHESVICNLEKERKNGTISFEYERYEPAERQV